MLRRAVAVGKRAGSGGFCRPVPARAGRPGPPPVLQQGFDMQTIVHFRVQFSAAENCKNGRDRGGDRSPGETGQSLKIANVYSHYDPQIRPDPLAAAGTERATRIRPQPTTTAHCHWVNGPKPAQPTRQSTAPVSRATSTCRRSRSPQAHRGTPEAAAAPVMRPPRETAPAPAPAPAARLGPAPPALATACRGNTAWPSPRRGRPR